jgi:hypothetical protein
MKLLPIALIGDYTKSRCGRGLPPSEIPENGKRPEAVEIRQDEAEISQDTL